jgi:DNA-directed RNA polymerase subunit beta'
LQFNLSKTVIGAKNILKKDSTFAFHLLKKIMKNIPVLLNRAPTLHRLGFQAFLPKLIEGRAILLHPMVCPGFNADFDGDQMAVHVPLTVEARTEAWKFMLSTNNFINSATGDPVLLPTQDMVLGCYYLTTDFQSKSGAVQILNSLRKEKNGKFYNFQKKYKNFLFFSNCADVFSAYQRKNISLHSPIWIRWNGIVDFGNESTKPVEIQVLPNGSYKQILPKMTTFSNEKNEIFSKFIRTTPGRIFINFVMKEFQKDSFIHSKTFEFS